MASSTKSRSGSKKSTSSRKASSSSSSSSSSSKKQTKEVTDGGAIADNRASAGNKGNGVIAGRVDNMTRRSASDALEGHFVHVDHTASGISQEAKDALGGRTGYGVYIEPGETDEGGFPKTAVVQLRDSSGARIVVPYESLSPVDPTDRRA